MAELRPILRCPRDRARLAGDSPLSCERCGADYPIREGIPQLVAPEDLQSDAAGFYNAPNRGRYGRDRESMPEVLARPVRSFVAALDPGARVLEIGSGRGAFDSICPGYIALDISFAALRDFSTGRRIQADAEALPFADASLEAVFTVASLEHVPNPERSLAEIDRVLCPGGMALIYPAWYVRPWTSRGLHLRSYRELGWPDRIRKATIPLRDRREYQFARAVPGRIIRELRLLHKRPLPFYYRPLDPELERYAISDSDAFASMDPHAASAFFCSRGYRDLNRPIPLKRFAYAYEPVVVEKTRP